MKKFFSVLLKITLVLLFVALCVLTECDIVTTFIPCDSDEGGSSVLFGYQKTLFLVADDSDMPLYDANVDGVIVSGSHDVVKIFVSGTGLPLILPRLYDGYRIAVLTNDNGNFLLLDRLTVSRIVLIGWFFYITLIATYWKDLVGGVKTFFTNIKNKFKKKEKQE